MLFVDPVKLENIYYICYNTVLVCSGIAVSGGCFNHVMSCVISSAITLGYVDSILEEYRAALRVRVALHISIICMYVLH